MRSVRPRRQSFVDLRYVQIGDYIVLFAALMAVVSLFLPWLESTIGTHSQNAFTFSPVCSAVVILAFIVTFVLALYPALTPELNLPRLGFSTPLIFLFIGSLLLLLFTYELGKYACIECATSSRGYGVWVAWVSAGVYIVGAIIKWGSRPLRRSSGEEVVGDSQ